MSNQPKRRPINAVAPEKEEAQPAAVPQEPVAPVTPEPPAPVPEAESPVPRTPSATVPDSDEEWEKQIAAAKAKMDQAKTEPPAAPVEPATPAYTTIPAKEASIIESTPAPNPNAAMEAEIERRVAERLAAQQAKAEEAKKPEATNEVKENPDEELAQKHAVAAKKNNAAGLIFVNLGTDDDFEAAIDREFEEDERPESEKTRNPTDYASGMSLIRELGQRTQQQKLLKTWIMDLLKDHPEALKEVDNKLRVNKIIPKIGDGTGPKKLSGSAAKAAVISRLKGMFRIQLYNSGFWIDICPPSLVEIDNWMQEVDQEFKELGRVLGGHAYTCIDVFLKRKLCEILPSLVQRSNYENWENKDQLLANISYHDYDTILWGLCCSMYKDGIGIGVYCTNPDCRYVDAGQYLDLARLCYLNTEKFPKAALEWMTTYAYNAAKLLTDNDLANYRDKLLNFSKTVSVDNGTSVYELTVPSIIDFVNRGAALIGKITALTNNEKSVQTDIVTNQLTFHLYKMLLPWIKSLSMNDTEGNLIYRIEDKDAIYESLDINTFDESDFYKTVVSFIEETKLSYYAAHTLKCPKCGKTAELDKDNLMPLDLQYVFFGLCCLQMNQTGASF